MVLADTSVPKWEKELPMRRRTEKGREKQVGMALRNLGKRAARALLPMMAGLVAAKEDLLGFMNAMGHEAVERLFLAEVESLVGPAKKHQKDRKRYRWGSAPAELTLGGRRVTFRRPRVRECTEGASGREIALESVLRFQKEDPLPERVLEQMLLGISARKYERSLEPVPEGWRPHGTSKSAASRHVVAHTRKRVTEFLRQRLDEVPVVALMLDGVEIAKHTVVVALGITAKGDKVPLGLEAGSTENAALCASLLQGLLDRGLTLEGRVLFVVDGAKGLRRAIEDVFGDVAVVQRCQAHKRRNVLRLVPERCHAYVKRSMNEAYSATSAETARKHLRRLVEWLERDGHDTAAASLREGLEETLTVHKLGLSGSLRAFFATTNAIENLIGTVREVSGNVKRWRKGDMVKRWAGIGLVEAQKRFRRIRGHRGMPALVNALRPNAAASIDMGERVA
jgi:transposase-like protein